MFGFELSDLLALLIGVILFMWVELKDWWKQGAQVDSQWGYRSRFIACSMMGMYGCASLLKKGK